jgi:hypothetical protein
VGVEALYVAHGVTINVTMVSIDVSNCRVENREATGIGEAMIVNIAITTLLLNRNFISESVGPDHLISLNENSTLTTVTFNRSLLIGSVQEDKQF